MFKVLHKLYFYLLPQKEVIVFILGRPVTFQTFKWVLGRLDNLGARFLSVRNDFILTFQTGTAMCTCHQKWWEKTKNHCYPIVFKFQSEVPFPCIFLSPKCSYLFTLMKRKLSLKKLRKHWIVSKCLHVCLDTLIKLQSFQGFPKMCVPLLLSY